MYNRNRLALILSSILGAVALLGFCEPATADYSLVWSDEFNGTSLDTDDWNIDIGDGCPDLCGWGNNELQYYREENISVSGGNLVITALAESYGGRSYTSGKIHTRDKHFFMYGRIEMRAKLPYGSGVWPAFWMMPQYSVYGGWASSGELDIMEAANSMTSVGGTLHYGGTWPNNTYTNGSYSLGGTSFADDFHIYAVEWEPDEIRWYVDDVLYSTKTSSQWYSDAAPGNDQAPFDQEFYIILNAAVGGNYTGCTSSSCVTTNLPTNYLIDYVRVYQESDNVAPTVTLTYPVEGDNPPAGALTMTATATDSDGTIDRVEFYNGSTYLGEDDSVPYEATWSNAPIGCYEIIARAYDDGGAFAEDSQYITVGSGCGQAPYSGGAFVFPVRVEAEDFDIGGEGVAYHDTSEDNEGGSYRTSESVDLEDCSDSGGGYNLGWINPGEWVEYTVYAIYPGDYPVEVRVASESSGGSFHLEFNGVDRTGELIVPVTGGWQEWTTVTATVTLETGLQTLRFVPTSDGFNVNYIEFLDVETPVSPELLPRTYTLHPCYPNPFNPTTTISFDLPETATVNLTIYDVAGKLVRTLVAGEQHGAGRHEVTWYGRDTLGQRAASGIYFYRLEAGDYTATRRMTLLQ